MLCRSQKKGDIYCGSGCLLSMTGQCRKCIWSVLQGPLHLATVGAFMYRAMSQRCHWKQNRAMSAHNLSHCSCHLALLQGVRSEG